MPYFIELKIFFDIFENENKSLGIINCKLNAVKKWYAEIFPSCLVKIPFIPASLSRRLLIELNNLLSVQAVDAWRFFFFVFNLRFVESRFALNFSSVFFINFLLDHAVLVTVLFTSFLRDTNRKNNDIKFNLHVDFSI